MSPDSRGVASVLRRAGHSKVIACGLICFKQLQAGCAF
jgi:hypothetical protein